MLLLVPGAAVAAEPAAPSPSPSRLPCGAPPQQSVSAAPSQIASGATTTVTVVWRADPCYTERVPQDVTLYARPDGTQAEPVVVGTGRTDASGQVSFALAPTASTEYCDLAAFTPLLNGPRVARVLVDAARPPDDCQSGTPVSLDRDAVTATGSAVLTVHDRADSLVDVYAYTRPSTAYRLVRSLTTGADGTARTTLRPPANTRLRAVPRVEDCTEPVFGSAPPVVLSVRTALTLTTRRTGTCEYAFAGDSLPARDGGLVVSLHRVTTTGSQVLTAQARASATTGEWRLTRTFTGSGRFGFVVRTGQDLQNAAGTSAVRPTLVF